MKRLKFLFTVLCTLCGTMAFAHNFEVDGIYYNITDATNKTVAVTYSGSHSSAVANEYTGDVVIPESVTYNSTTYSVTSIGGYAFSGCSGLTSIEIPNSVTSIGYGAFNGCYGLTSVTIGNSVVSIENDAFYGCSGLTSIEIPNSVTSIGEGAFSGCSGLKEVHINDLSAWCNISFYSLYGNPLYYAKNLYLNGELVTDLVIPDDVKKIKINAFYGCSGLTSIEIPNSVTSIGGSAFSGCSGLTSIEIPNSVTSIGNWAFEFCSGLTSVTIPNSVTSIGGGAFYNCSGLTSIEIPNSVTSIGISAFNGCYGLTSIVIPNSVTSIEDYAFRDCSGLTSVTIGNSVTSIGYEAFGGFEGILEFTADKPIGLYAGLSGKVVLIVPDASLDAYKAAWSSYAAQVTGKSDAFVTVDVEAMEATSAIMERVGIDKMASVVKLTVKGSINSYDVIQFRDKMPLLRELDLSEATVVASNKAFYDGYCTKENDLGGYAFYNLSKLDIVKLPKDLVAIGDYMFYECSSLKAIRIPENVQRIGASAFQYCRSLKEITIPAGVKHINYRTFHCCESLEQVTLPDGLVYVDMYAFYSCYDLKDIKLPPTVRGIDGYAFNGCSSLEEIRIPSSVTYIGMSAFANCGNLKRVYTYTVEPTAIQENTFSTFATATLYVPSVSFSNYYWDDGWKRFLNLAEFNEPYEYFYVNNDYVLNDDTGYIEGVGGENPDADINAGGGFIVEGEQGDEEEPNQSLGDVNVGSNGEGTSGSIIGDNNLHIDNLNIKINVIGGRWYFFAFPFDIKFDKIYMENGSDFVFRYYDGEERAKKGNGGWKDINEDHLKAARGYIFQCSANDVLVLNIKDVKFKKEDKFNELLAHVSENMKDASWNFVGNPYLSYYDMADMDYTAPVTVWDGSKYVAIRPGDDDYHFAPYEAFFVQKPENQDEIAFDGEEQMTKHQSDNKKERQAVARRVRGVDSERQLVNLVLGNGTADDRARIVFNENQSLAYEIACDATKFETAGVPQLYTIGNDKVNYAINERPADNGRVALGYTAPTAGLYTIDAQRMDVVVYVKDFKTGTLHNLKDGAYSFSTNAGRFNDRFEILLGGTAPGTTGIDEMEDENGNAECEIYDLQGRKMKDAGKGIYIINGEKVMK